MCSSDLYQRDAKGRLTRATEETGGQTTNKSWEYDADGKLTKESITTQGATSVCRYAYDSVGNRVEKDCDGQKTRYVYNQHWLFFLSVISLSPKTTIFRAPRTLDAVSFREMPAIRMTSPDPPTLTFVI